MATVAEKLAWIKNYHTRYEIALTHPDGRRYLVQYNSAKSRHGLFRSMRERGADLVRITGETHFTIGKRAADGATMGAWQIRFTGRTQRDCILTGELEFVGSESTVQA